MRFRPRHYLLILVILGLGIFNYMRGRRAVQQPTTAAPAVAAKPLPPGVSPAWPAYDTAAGLRDAPDAQFQQGLKRLTDAIAGNGQKASDEIQDLQGCRTWLLFYRQEHLHPAINKPGWAQQLTTHVISCVAHHRDIGL